MFFLQIPSTERRVVGICWAKLKPQGPEGPLKSEADVVFDVSVIQSTKAPKEIQNWLQCRVSLGRTGDEPQWLTNEGKFSLACGWALAGAASLLLSGVSSGSEGRFF
jgi:hypothetical protein